MSKENNTPSPAKTESKSTVPSHPDYSSAPTDIPTQGTVDLDRPVVASSANDTSNGRLAALVGFDEQITAPGVRPPTASTIHTAEIASTK